MIGESSKNSIFAKVLKLTAKIPPGKVTTYGTLAERLGIKDARIVGWALHGNKDQKIPCHRVVNVEGGLAANYAFGGDKEQRLRLLAEGVTFTSEHRVDLKRHLWVGGV